MRKFTKVFIIGLAVTVMAIPSFAASLSNPAEIYGELSGKTSLEAWEEMRESEMTFGELAEENGFGEAFREAVQEAHKERVSELLEEGKITNEQAEIILADIEDCDGIPGTHAGTHGLYYGRGFGVNAENGLHSGYGRGQGRGQGGLRDGSGFGGRWNTDSE